MWRVRWSPHQPAQRVPDGPLIEPRGGKGKVSFQEFVQLFSSSNPVARASVRAASMPRPRMQ